MNSMGKNTECCGTVMGCRFHLRRDVRPSTSCEPSHQSIKWRSPGLPAENAVASANQCLAGGE